MKRVEVSPGRYVTVSTEMAQRAVQAFASGAVAAKQVEEAAVVESRHPTRQFIGGAGFEAASSPRPGAHRR